tara:strand:+ start:1547 stop:2221 length:675 start_codon:yes stop_codon:yes gene_type:complete
MNKLKVIIPARGGSKGVPGKNIKKVNNIPLLAYPILAAQKSKFISDIYVSTDDDDIALVALNYGAKVINRPDHLAQDNSLDVDVMKHAVEQLEDLEDIVHLRATTPMIDHNIVDDAIIYFYKHIDCTSLRSAHESPESAYKSFKLNSKYWQGLFDNEYTGEYYNLPRQQLPNTYNPNGYIDIIKPTHFMNNESLHGDKILAYVTSYAHEIDTIDDFKILEALHG